MSNDELQRSTPASRDQDPMCFDTLSGMVRALDERAASLVGLRPCLGWGLRIKACLARCVLATLRRLLFHAPSGVPPARIVIYTVGTLGDNVVMAPALAAIRETYPQAHITLVNNVQEWSRSIAEGFLGQLPYLDRLVCIEGFDCPVQRRGARFRVVVPELADLETDLFVNLSPFGNRGWPGVVFRELLWARRMRARHAVGFTVVASKSRGPFANIRHRYVVNEPTRGHMILSQLGVTPPSNWTLPRNVNSAATVSDILDAMGVQPGTFGMIHPGAKYQFRRWPPDKFGAAAAGILEATGMRCVVTGACDETSVCEAVVAASRGAAISLAGRTDVWDLIELARTAQFCITNDTGAMHVAAAVGTPTVAIFSAYQNPQRWFPNSKTVRVFWTGAECAMCGLDHCEHIRCLTAISPEAVVSSCLSLVNGPQIRRQTASTNLQ